MLSSPTMATYILFEAIEDKKKVLLGLLPICLGIISLYFWIHVKIHFDQLSKAGRQVRPVGPPPLQQPQPLSQQKPNNNGPMTITLMAPYPPYDKNYSIYDTTGEVQFTSAKPLNPVENPENRMKVPPATPLVQPPTPTKAPPASTF